MTRSRSFAAIVLLAAALGAGIPAQAQQRSPSAAAPASDLMPRLLPAPRELVSVGVPQRFQTTIGFEGLRADADRSAAREFVEAMRERGIRAELNPSGRHWSVAILRRDTREAESYLTRQRLVFDPAMEAEGYILVTTADGAHLIADSDAGVFYGLQTLKQLFAGAGDGLRLHSVTIRDWPAMRWRGVHDDLSRGPVPTLDYQKRQIRLLAAYKVNVFSPYFEHTLAF
nr:glycosyl hydrolase [Gemmatimonadota bacterium]